MTVNVVLAAFLTSFKHSWKPFAKLVFSQNGRTPFNPGKSYLGYRRQPGPSFCVSHVPCIGELLEPIWLMHAMVPFTQRRPLELLSLSVEGTFALRTVHCDWLAELAPLPQPMRSKAKSIVPCEREFSCTLRGDRYIYCFEF